MPLLQAGSSTLNYPFKIGREKSLNLRSSSSSYFTCAKAHARLSFCAPIRAFSIASNMRSSSLGYKYRHGSKKNRQEMSRQKKKKESTQKLRDDKSSYRFVAELYPSLFFFFFFFSPSSKRSKETKKREKLFSDRYMALMSGVPRRRAGRARWKKICS